MTAEPAPFDHEDTNTDDRPSRFKKSISGGFSVTEKVAQYDAWANKYDEDMRSYGYTGPEIAVEYMKRYFKDTNGKYLDCGAGTGPLGVHNVKSTITFFSRILDTYDGLLCCGCFVPSHLEPDCVEDWCRIVKPGGIVFIVMNQRWLSQEPAYNEGKLDGAFQKRVDEGKWELVVREQRDKYLTENVAEVFVFKVK
ncbi:uncharacterized protein [Antedon mediterranea]|uniref:uncharacterized protein n=1 Tax=Antedon mediterranea TaxID=105859 RepID=UPI003AF755C8